MRTQSPPGPIRRRRIGEDIRTPKKRPTPAEEESLPLRPTRKRRPRRKSKRMFFFVVTIAIAIAGGFIHQIFFAQETVEPLRIITRLPVIKGIRDFVGSNDGLLKGESVDRINFLVLGQGGVGHDGPFLSDTNIVVSLKPSTGQIALLSLPRDMLVYIPGYGNDRINLANSIGETTGYPGGGAALAARVVEDTLGIPINYYARIDFAGFEQFVDELGGVEIDIDRAFTDNQYPDGKNGYTTISFNAGPQKLSGEESLQFVRSRHSPEEQGDFSRARRQQKFIVALKDRILTPTNLLNPGKLVRTFKNLNDHIVTNAQLWELKSFLELAKEADFEYISFQVLDDSPAGPLYSTTTDRGAYVLAPKISDYSEIRFIAKNLFTLNDIKREKSGLVIRNGTPEEGLALNTAAILQAFEFDVINISNADSKNYQSTVLYDLSGGTKPSSLTFLEATLQITAQKTLPRGDDYPDADFLIILGSDQLPKSSTANGKTSFNTL